MRGRGWGDRRDPPKGINWQISTDRDVNKFSMKGTCSATQAVSVATLSRIEAPPVDKAGEVIDKAGEVIDKAGEVIDKAGEVIDKAGEVIDKAGEAIDKAGEVIDKAGEDMHAQDNSKNDININEVRIYTYKIMEHIYN
eukprot:GHVR01130185.1.p2 GENE.GHVR01130185.1~~GHVR01130185.1.p2  ORF type:complete len:139 (+),score=26.12 GHVR01130185.1:1372-1788(+)